MCAQAVPEIFCSNMGETHKGTDTLENMESSWFIISEAECENDFDTLEELFDESTDGSNISNLIDDDENETDEGNPLALYNSQVADECDKAITKLKRKYVKSPQQDSIAALSPRLEAIRITPERQIKRRLFQDSGLGEDETTCSITQVESLECVTEQIESGANSENGASDACKELLLCSNRRAKMLGKFKEYFQVPYTELTRTFKSDKTCGDNWIVVLYAVTDDVIEATKLILQQHCNNLQIITFSFTALCLLQFKHAKNRETIIKMFNSVLNIQEYQLLCDPPKIRSTPAALWFYKKSIAGTSYVFNALPDWVTKLTMVNHQTAANADSFDLSEMIQWAYDHNYIEEPQIAYNYALLADVDRNAAAFLNSNSQVKFVKDCSAMVRLYKRQEMREMSISEWIYKCCNQCEEDGDWKIIADFLKFQNVSVVGFLSALRTMFKQVPKKSCILIYGEPDTGKSYFCYSLINFLKGRVISYVNRGSQFWLQPLLDGKFGFLDDATMPCWLYIDSNLRSALDGNSVSLDAKHRAPQQLKLPPMFITSNIDVLNEPSLRYLHSRLVCFKFANKMPFTENGNLIYNITDKNWKCFFRKLYKQLDLEPEEENESIRPDRTFKCTARSTDEDL